ncbi:glycosyltransferase family 2 protein [Rhodococcus sp. G-MC3]|uniref:glycosyltransferase family 2 protein n=1 Tax=Rhodococcus sp. G-MC3 TaxID=3046209 RepID=UPI0024B8B5BE|nr:glycosyltransferase family 2 protein [Rhodococcus sp. G-MC3]MDJ0396362.1 glycosyltransferase family 2 protein [Rhodococcus sp. G-MC3]
MKETMAANAKPNSGLPLGAEGKVSVSVVMVTYNSRALLEHISAELFATTGIEVIVVDNDSQDGCADFIRTNLPAVQLIESGANLGFAKAVNIGVKIAKGETIVLLNPDASISPHSILALHNLLKIDPEIGAIAPLLHHPGRQLAVREAGMKPSLWRMFCHYFGLSRLVSGNRYFRGMYILRSQQFSTIDVDWVSGACVAIPAQIWKELNGLTERWFMYAEDVEFCLRVKSSGRRVVLSAEIQGDHGLGQSNSESDERPGSEWLVNLYDLYKTDISRSRLQNVAWKYVFATGMILRAAGHAVRAILQRRSYLENSDYIRFAFYSTEVLRLSSKAGRHA